MKTMRKVYCRTLIKELRQFVKQARPHDLTFKTTGKLSQKERERLQEQLNYHFNNWAETWIYPRLDALEAETER